VAGRRIPVPARTPAGIAGGPLSRASRAAGRRSRRTFPATVRCSPRRGCRSSPRGGSRRLWFRSRPRCFRGGDRPGSGAHPLSSRSGERTAWEAARPGRPCRGTTRREQVAAAGRSAASRAAPVTAAWQAPVPQVQQAPVRQAPARHIPARQAPARHIRARQAPARQARAAQAQAPRALARPAAARAGSAARRPETPGAVAPGAAASGARGSGRRHSARPRRPWSR
jgi:hypothetical protein